MLQLSARVLGPRPLVVLLKQVAHRSSVAASASLQDTARPFHEIPGPKALPLLGNGWRFFPVIGEYHNLSLSDLFTTYQKQYGDIVRIVGIPGQPNTVYLFNPEDIEKTFRNEGRWPSRDFTPSFTYYRMVTRKDLFQGNGGVLSAQGEEWQRLRSKVNPALMQPRNAKLYVNQIDQVSQEFINRMRKLRDDKLEMPSDFDNELSKWALESIALVALDTRLGCLADKLDENSEVQRMIRAVIDVIVCMYKLDFQPSFWKYVSTPTWRRFVQSMDCFTEVAQKYVTEAMERVKQKPADSENDYSILERILLQGDPKMAFVTSLDLLFGGVDTTANSVAILLYYLARNPEKQQKLFEEVNRFLPSSETPLTADHLEDMKYLRACMKESMRLSPVAFGNARTLTSDMVIADYQVPKGTNVFMLNMHLSNSEKHYPQADKFIPERWMKGPGGEPSPSKETHPFVFMPFGFGPRMCLGRRFAEMEMHTLIARLIQNFRVEYDYEMKFKQILILKPASPLKYKMIDRG